MAFFVTRFSVFFSTLLNISPELKFLVRVKLEESNILLLLSHGLHTHPCVSIPCHRWWQFIRPFEDTLTKYCLTLSRGESTKFPEKREEQRSAGFEKERFKIYSEPLTRKFFTEICFFRLRSFRTMSTSSI